MGPPKDRAEPDRSLPSYGSYALLLPLILGGLVVSGFEDRSPTMYLLSRWLAMGNLLLALFVSRVGRRYLLAVACLALVAAAAWGPARSHHRWSEIVVVAAFGALTLLAPVAILRRVRRAFAEEGVDREVLLGTLCAYLYIGGWYAFLYRAVGILSNAPFFAQPETETGINYLYFSFVTLATVGFGDLSPAPGPGRMLAATEGVVGQLYLVSVVALVVSAYARRGGTPP